MDTDDNLPGDARAAALLRRALHTEADRVDVRPDGLTAIRGKIDARRRRRMPAVLLGAAAATVAASLVGVVGCLPPAPQPGPPSGAASVGPAPP
ncbi:hypothetical protein, partial [Micromonospora sp. LOL_021]|uniref:hypothetical protein n=1 Tax=Micromonospora sp. LOL_021 TaxID=3345417 RepID=UPI003A8353F7